MLAHVDSKASHKSAARGSLPPNSSFRLLPQMLRQIEICLTGQATAVIRIPCCVYGALPV